MSFDRFSNCTRSADYTKPTATAPRVWQVEAEIDALQKQEAWGDNASVLARTLAAEVDARDAKLEWAQQVIKAQEETSNGVACATERAAGNGGCGACSWCCAQARAEVDARDEVITKLLAMLEPGEKPNYMDPKYNPSKMPRLTEYNLDCMWHGMRKQAHARACAIAEGRTP